MPLEYKIDVLQALKDKGYNTSRLRKEKLLSESTIQKLRERKPISWANIEQICRMLDCQPESFLVFIEGVTVEEADTMMEEYDFSNAKKNPYPHLERTE